MMRAVGGDMFSLARRNPWWTLLPVLALLAAWPARAEEPGVVLLFPPGAAGTEEEGPGRGPSE